MVQVQEMSYKEKVEMYNLIDKKGLIDMLIEANKCLQMLEQKVKIDFIDSSLQLNEKEILNFEDWKTKYVKVQGEGTYIYDKTSYNLGMIRYFYKEYVNSSL